MKYVPPKKLNTEEVEEIIDDIWNQKRPKTNGSLSNPQNEDETKVNNQIVTEVSADP